MKKQSKEDMSECNILEAKNRVVEEKKRAAKKLDPLEKQEKQIAHN